MKLIYVLNKVMRTHAFIHWFILLTPFSQTVADPSPRLDDSGHLVMHN